MPGPDLKPRSIAPSCDGPIANLRTISFYKLLDRESAELERLMSACREDGFFYLDLNAGSGGNDLLKNHEDVSDIMKGWFARSVEEKLKTPTISNSHGYKPIGIHTGVGGGKDGWEAIKLGRTELEGKWALPSVVSDNYSVFRDFHDRCHFVTKVLLDCVSAGLGLVGSESLQRHHRDDAPSKSSLFLVHYPPLESGNARGEIGQNMHTDLGSLTLLFAPQWGLQVLCPANDGDGEAAHGSVSSDAQALDSAWQWVEPLPGCAIVNVGDTLRFLSENRLRSALHRALPLANGEDRYSIAYF
ncbi:hypothetical protein HIM_03221 [Hirsutella minnesotensis 3608]|nr:hypothetical protein HIM_03221 [Hirsutella minnesotensis 3608]